VPRLKPGHCSAKSYRRARHHVSIRLHTIRLRHCGPNDSNTLSPKGGTLRSIALAATPAAAATDADKAALAQATATCKTQVKEQTQFQETSLYARHKMVKKCVQDALAASFTVAASTGEYGHSPSSRRLGVKGSRYG
jgi:hypothetical protein